MISYAFMKDETTQSYRWVLEKLKSFLVKAIIPSTIVTDKEGGLLKSVAEVFPNSKHLLCSWHINNDVEAHVSYLCNKNRYWCNVQEQVFEKKHRATSEAEYNHGRSLCKMVDRY